MIAVLVSLIIIVVYTISICVKYGIPVSISDSYYYLGWKPLFTFIMWLCGGLVLPRSMDMAAMKGTTEIIPFLAILGIFLVGAAPRVRDYERKIHMIGALACGIFSQLWVILYGNPWSLLSWIIPLTVIVSSSSGGYMTLKILIKNLDSRFKIVFWMEISCFLSMYISLLS